MVRVANELQMTAEFRDGCCKLPQMYPQQRKIRQEPISSDDFHTIPTHFIQNIYKLSPMKACQWLNLIFFHFVHLSDGLRGKSDTWICFYLAGKRSGSFLGWHHTALVERNLFLCTLSSGTALFLRNFQQFYHLHYCLHYLVVIFHSLSEKFSCEL